MAAAVEELTMLYQEWIQRHANDIDALDIARSVRRACEAAIRGPARPDKMDDPKRDQYADRLLGRDRTLEQLYNVARDMAEERLGRCPRVDENELFISLPGGVKEGVEIYHPIYTLQALVRSVHPFSGTTVTIDKGSQEGEMFKYSVV